MFGLLQGNTKEVLLFTKIRLQLRNQNFYNFGFYFFVIRTCRRLSKCFWFWWSWWYFWDSFQLFCAQCRGSWEVRVCFQCLSLNVLLTKRHCRLVYNAVFSGCIWRERFWYFDYYFLSFFFPFYKNVYTDFESVENAIYFIE